MSDAASPVPPVSAVAGISAAHNTIIAHLFELAGLPTHVPLDATARAVVARAIAFFDRSMHAHHQAEENHLFPTVLALAVEGAERAYLQAMVAQLTQEHRKIEALWAELSAQLQHLVAGGVSPSTDAHIQRLVLDYGDHATREESELLPLCHEILQRSTDASHAASLQALHL